MLAGIGRSPSHTSREHQTQCSITRRRFSHAVFNCEIDVQVGSRRSNYINGYVAKDHDAVDVGMGEYKQKSSTAPWLATYRLISKSCPSLPEVAIRMAQLSEFDRSYTHVLLYPPQPVDVLTPEGRRRNFSSRMYATYLEEARGIHTAGETLKENVLVWHRVRQYDSVTQCCVFRGGRHRPA